MRYLIPVFSGGSSLSRMGLSRRVDAMAVDTHVFRVSNRIGIVNTQTPEKTEFALMDAIPKKRWSHSHHLLIFHGRRICKARKPECGICPITKYCKYYKNNFDKVHS